MDVIIELGGNPSRIHRVIELAKQNQSAKIVISSETLPDFVVGLLRGAGISNDRFVFDFTAWDTVTNFTKTVKMICDLKPKKLYIVTDKFHMRRSMVIANAIYFLRGIALIPESYYGSEPHQAESDELVNYDRWRSWVWRITGWLQYIKLIKDQRMPGIEADARRAREAGYPVTG